MGLVISSTLAKKLRDNIRQTPLVENEIRRIVGLGEQYIAKSDTNVDAADYITLFGLKIYESHYIIYRRIPR
jgi:hypothetical protein